MYELVPRYDALASHFTYSLNLAASAIVLELTPNYNRYMDSLGTLKTVLLSRQHLPL